MAIHPNFPTSPHEILKPEYRWFPADEVLRESSYEKLLPPFVHKIRKEVEQWRNKDYEGATHTSRALLLWWFKNQHIITKVDGTLVEFKYYFAQREAIETVIYLYEVARVKDKYDLIRYDSSGAVSTGMFDEEWLRLVIKMATGSGKTKVMSLIVTWCYFHKLYEDDSQLASNFLIIAPNIIVLDRLRTDFDGLRIFFSDWGSLSDNELEAIASGPTIGPPGSNRAQEIAKSILDEKKAEYMAELAKYNAKIRAKKRAEQQGDMEGKARENLGFGLGELRTAKKVYEYAKDAHNFQRGAMFLKEYMLKSGRRALGIPNKLRKLATALIPTSNMSNIKRATKNTIIPAYNIYTGQKESTQDSILKHYYKIGPDETGRGDTNERNEALHFFDLY